MDGIFQRQGALSGCAGARPARTVTRLKRRGLALGIATSDSRKGAMATLAPFGVLEQFDFIAGYDSGFGAKPERAWFWVSATPSGWSRDRSCRR